MPRQAKRQGYVYVLCFCEAFKHARHYIGCTSDPRGRLITHAQGRGAHIVKMAAAEGIGFRVSALGVCKITAMRRLERQVKDWHNSRDFCELCNEEPRAIPGTIPFPLFDLPFAQDSKALAVCRPEQPKVEYRFTDVGDLTHTAAAVRDMMQSNKESLGFIPCGGDAGLGVSMAARRMVVCEIDGQLAGYCSFTETPIQVRVQQLVVADAHRRCGIGRSLINCLRNSRPAVPITCRVRDDLIANEFWTAAGFELVGHSTHETSGARLFCYINHNGANP